MSKYLIAALAMVPGTFLLVYSVRNPELTQTRVLINNSLLLFAFTAIIIGALWLISRDDNSDG